MERFGDIAGKRVILRAAYGQDWGVLLTLSGDPGIGKVTKGYQRSAVSAYRMGASCFRPVPADSFRRIIADQEDPDTGLGVIMLSDMDAENGTAQIYIKLLEPARGRGYGQDAVDALVTYAFRELGLKCICSSILEDNTASRKLFEACGFRLEGIHEGRADRKGRCRKVCTYVRNYNLKENTI